MTFQSVAKYAGLRRRLFDLMMRPAALLLLLAILPLLLLIGAAIAACGRNPLFRQVRLGWNNRPFTILKLRTFDYDRARCRASTLQTRAFARLAQCLRHSRLDELPQLINILLGDMVFVGPRPLVALDLAEMGPERSRRQTVKPGLTGLAQLRGGKLLPSQAKLHADLHYIQWRSIRLDVRILLLTLPRTLQGIEAAYGQQSDFIGGAFKPIGGSAPEPPGVEAA